MRIIPLIAMVTISACKDRTMDRQYEITLSPDFCCASEEFPSALLRQIQINHSLDVSKYSVIDKEQTPEGFERARLSSDCIDSNILPYPQYLEYNASYSVSIYYNAECGPNYEEILIDVIEQMPGVSVELVYSVR